ncbi:hypothetical protein [Pseudomonas sp. PS02290]|uniref:hypothetical protein n=1 Tax=Pseudomonas sp. PS02290 TaxID=2991430 RepID=UPI00249CC406|nr:hypothetical protein [Pseudomonas sp. PS02290]
MTQVIEVVVIGAVGSGKSHVLELIDRAIHDEYGQHVQVASHELSRERYMGSPGTKPKVSETIFNLREQAPASGNQLNSDPSGTIAFKVDIDSSGIDEAIGKAETLHSLTSSYLLDPLQQAIDQTARLITDAEGELAIKLLSHLDTLLAEQLLRASGR